jgi:hypothetical protein
VEDTTINAWGFEPDVNEGAVINDGCNPYLGCWTSAVVRVRAELRASSMQRLQKSSVDMARMLLHIVMYN